MATNTSTVNQGTQRRDNWQLAPILTLLGLGGFGVYATWAALQNGHFELEGTQYLSPFYSPYFPHIFNALKIPTPDWLQGDGPNFWKYSPAFLILWAPAGFRATCYYYRKAYYRSFFTAPAACAVDTKVKSPLIALLGTGKRYLGEKAFPMVLQNLHRFFFYIAALFILILGWDAFASFFLPGFSGIYIGLGSLILTVNVILLALYTFGCHSYRHILGGHIDCFSTCPFGEQRHHAYQRQSILNEHHMLFAWLSLFTVGFADFYIRMVSMGVFPPDPHLSWTWADLITPIDMWLQQRGI